VNVLVAGEEADLSWPQERAILEIDGPQYHQFADQDARKQARWEGAGYTVRRLPSDVPYERPGELLNAYAAACAGGSSGSRGRSAR
jgi:very-short-patch-repair endonuclease